MKQMKNIYFTAAWIISLVLGILFSITLIGLVIGIPLFIASSKFKKANNMTDEELINNRGKLLGWGIFLSIVLTPSIFGLIIALIFVFMVNGYIKDLEVGNKDKTERGFGETVKEGASKTWNNIKETLNVKSQLDKEKDALIKLQQMKEEGIITEEEYEAKRKQILGL